MSEPQKYRALIVVEAVQWTGQNLGEIDAFIDDGDSTEPTDSTIFIETATGEVNVNVGDWLIRREPDGDLARVAGDVFAATYEAVSE